MRYIDTLKRIEDYLVDGERPDKALELVRSIISYGRDVSRIRIPWAYVDSCPMHMEYQVGVAYPKIGRCLRIIEHEPGVHYELLFENNFMTFYNNLITETYERETGSTQT